MQVLYFLYIKNASQGGGEIVRDGDCSAGLTFSGFTGMVGQPMCYGSMAAAQCWLLFVRRSLLAAGDGCCPDLCLRYGFGEHAESRSLVAIVPGHAIGDRCCHTTSSYRI